MTQLNVVFVFCPLQRRCNQAEYLFPGVQLPNHLRGSSYDSKWPFWTPAFATKVTLECGQQELLGAGSGLLSSVTDGPDSKLGALPPTPGAKGNALWPQKNFLLPQPQACSWAEFLGAKLPGKRAYKPEQMEGLQATSLVAVGDKKVDCSNTSKCFLVWLLAPPKCEVLLILEDLSFAVYPVG